MDFEIKVRLLAETVHRDESHMKSGHIVLQFYTLKKHPALHTQQL